MGIEAKVIALLCVLLGLGGAFGAGDWHGHKMQKQGDDLARDQAVIAQQKTDMLIIVAHDKLAKDASDNFEQQKAEYERKNNAKT